MKRIIFVAVVAWGIWSGLKGGGDERIRMPSLAELFEGGMTTEELQSVAATVKPGEVVMYTTTQCPYCAQARSWLKTYGFEFTECNTSVDADCERTFGKLGADGVPYLVVSRGEKPYHMKNGFDSSEFVAAVKQ